MRRLTDLKIKNAKYNNGKSRKLFDGDGLFVYITDKDRKKWRMQYSYGSKVKEMTLGSYPAVSLQNARNKRDEVRALLAEGISYFRAIMVQFASV
jgi:hypothetical protein